MEEESKKFDYFHSFLRTVENDLQNNRLTYVFNKEQLEAIKKKFNIEVEKDDGFCIYIRRKKGN